MMENEMEQTAFDDEFITMEVELESTATEEALKYTAMKEEMKVSCQVCDKIFAYPKTRDAHMRRIHHIGRTNREWKTRIICPLSDCHAKFFVTAALREHIVQTHNMDLEAEEHTFRSYEEFRQWKESMERETTSHYVKSKSMNLRRRCKAMGDFKEYFRCHRSGFFTPVGTGNRTMRRIGSKKIGAYCPSTLEVTHSAVNSYVKVVHWRKHLGHTCDMNYLPLTRSEKMEIADKINKGMSFSEIIKHYKDSAKGSKLYRINVLTNRDLSNIVERFNIKRNKIPESDDYLVNVWVKNMEEFGYDSPVAFFKRQGMENEQLNSEDFMIVIMTSYQKEMAFKNPGKNVCIDSIHGVNSNSFSLTTLLTIDELSAVFPLAFCISSKTDEVSMMVFLESVKRLVGIIETPVFMSNDDPVFYHAWEKVMAPASFQLLSNWHVDSCWLRDLEKISDKDKQASVYKTLRTLLEESDVSEFESSVENFVTELEEDASTRNFAEYFCENYIPRVKMWAFCYKRHLGISTVEHLEAMHTSLKTIFLDGGEDDNVYNSQVNLAIPALLKLSRDQLLGRSDDLLECLPVDYICMIRKGHTKGIKAYEITALSDNSWSVKLFKRFGGHVVTKNGACSQDVCYLRCYKCNICIHSFTCTCFDFLINLNICGHMHACARFSSVSESVNDKVAGENEKMNGVGTGGKEMVDTVVGDEEATRTSVEHEIIVDTVVGNEKVIETIVEHAIPSSKTLLTKQVNTIKTILEYTDFTAEQTTQLKNSFDAIISFMTMHGKSKIPFIPVPYQPSNNYVSMVNKEPQIQYQNKIITTGQPICLYTGNNFKQT